MNTSFCREMNMTHADFFRVLPMVVARFSMKYMQAPQCICSENSVTLTIENACLKILLTTKNSIKLGALRIPMMLVNFDYTGSDEVLELFMHSFDISFHKGGG